MGLCPEGQAHGYTKLPSIKIVAKSRKDHKGPSHFKSVAVIYVIYTDSVKS